MSKSISTIQSRWFVCATDELGPGQRKIITIHDQSIGVFNINGMIVAVLNLCPHQFAPICSGRLSGTTLASLPGEYIWGREGEILSCPWHGWEFDMLTGQCLTDKSRLRIYSTLVEQGSIFVLIAEGNNEK